GGSRAAARGRRRRPAGTRTAASTPPTAVPCSGTESSTPGGRRPTPDRSAACPGMRPRPAPRPAPLRRAGGGGVPAPRDPAPVAQCIPPRRRPAKSRCTASRRVNLPLAMLRDLAPLRDAREIDVLVVGGGINGAGIARDAALRGLGVVLV